MSTDIRFVDADTSPGDSIRWSEADTKLSHYYGKTKVITLIDAATYSDYSGGTVEQSNFRVMTEDPEIAPHLITLTGSHGTQGLAYVGTWDELRADPERKALCDAISALSNYPLLSEDDHSSLEVDLESEAWESYGREDFRKALGPLLDTLDEGHEHDADTISDDDLYQLWHDGCSALNVNGGAGCHFETGGTCYFYTAEWIDRAGDDPQDSPWKNTLRNDLMAFAKACRCADETP